LLAAMDRTSANLERLQAIWDRAAPTLPSGPALGSDNEYEDLARAWKDLLSGLPRIDGWTITAPLPATDEIGQAFLDYQEIGESPVGVWDATEAPGRDRPVGGRVDGAELELDGHLVGRGRSELARAVPVGDRLCGALARYA
jgi:hypothetical protein